MMFEARAEAHDAARVMARADSSEDEVRYATQEDIANWI
jgi:hypothetical protein